MDVNGNLNTKGTVILGQDPQFSPQAATKNYVDQINANKVNRSGDTMTGPLTLAGAPTNPLDAATKAYVDSIQAGLAQLSGASFTGPVLLSQDPLVSNEAATKNYVDSVATEAVGGDLTGNLPNPTIAAKAVSNTKLADAPASTLKGNDGGSPATPSDLTVPQVKTLLAYVASDILTAGGPTVEAALATKPNLTTLNTFTAAQGVVPVVVNPATGTITPDFSVSNTFIYTQTGNLTLSTPTNPQNGFTYRIVALQDSTGGWIFTPPSNFDFKGGSASFSTVPNSINFIDAVYNSATGRYIADWFSNAVVVTYPTALFALNAPFTVANTVTETSVANFSLPANFFTLGRSIKITGFGFHSAVASPTIQINIKYGSTTIITTGAVTSGNSTNDLVELRALITCNTTGATGTVSAQGFYQESGGGVNQFPMVALTPVTIDTTTPTSLDVTVQWGTASASNTETWTNILFEVA